MAERKRLLSPEWNVVIGGLLLISSLLAAQAGVIPILGLLIAAFAPDIFLAGTLLLALGILRALKLNLFVAAVLAIAAAFVIGLNTRMATFYSDIRGNGLSETRVLSRYEGAVGQPIHVEAKTSEISGRRHQYSHAMPNCRGDDCLATSGFRTPYPWLEHDYWHEKVIEVVLASGFSKANEAEHAPTLLVTQVNEEFLSNIHFELRNPDGQLMAQYDGRYRRGFPSETEDGLNSEKVWKSLALEYLLHGNILNRIAARQVSAAQSYPLTSFLKTATQLSHPQGQALGLMSPGGASSAAPPSTGVVLEVLDQKDYEPVWVIKEEPRSDTSKWSALAWDKERGDRCKALLRPETPNAPLMQTWHLFVNDPTGRRKVRYTGAAICDPDAIWFLDYVIEKGRTTLTKYFTNGELAYRLSFEKPPEPYGYPGGILIPTFKSVDGYLQFEWWNTNQSGFDRHIKRSIKVRLQEPMPPPNIAVQGTLRDKAAQRP